MRPIWGKEAGGWMSLLDYFHVNASDPTNSAPPGLTDVVALAAGDTHSLTLNTNGTVAG